MGRSSLPFSACIVGNLDILFRRQQILCSVRARGVSPEHSSELQSKSGVLNDPVHKSLFALAKPEPQNQAGEHWSFIPLVAVFPGSLKCLVSDAIRNFLTQLGGGSQMLWKHSFLSVFVDPWALAAHLFRGRKNSLFCPGRDVSCQQSKEICSFPGKLLQVVIVIPYHSSQRRERRWCLTCCQPPL